MENEKKYQTLLMYKVFTATGIVMFQDKKSAEIYTEALKNKKEMASLNKWTWETNIEE